MSWSKLLAAALAATPVAAPATAPQMAFQDLAGRPVTLAQVVGDRPTLLVFLRHFG